MAVLQELEPKEVFHYFKEISAIPRGSGNTEQISAYLTEFAKKNHLKYIQDELNNVIIFKEASKGHEDAGTLILQGHMDMVCEKTAESEIDFFKDGLELVIEGDYIHANGTTLGGDDGIALSYALAVLASDTIEHPAIEAVFTVDEEIGLLGANGIDVSMLKGRALLNIDSEIEGILTVGCAGGLTATCSLPVQYKDAEGYRYRLILDGLKGGHSGIEIDKERGNSNLLMARLLHRLGKEIFVGIAVLEGGLKDNAIPVRTVCEVLIEEADRETLEDGVKKYQEIISKEYRTTDPEIQVRTEFLGKSEAKVLSMKSGELSVFLLMNVPNGVQRMSPDIAGLVQTSLNLGILKLKEETLLLSFSVRSSVESEKWALSDRLQYLTEFLGGEYSVHGNYPGWEYNPDSRLRELMIEIYREQYGTEPVVETIHAGLECGLFCGKIEGLDCISIGPDMLDIHTPLERLSISSAGRVWKYILELLKRFRG